MSNHSGAQKPKHGSHKAQRQAAREAWDRQLKEAARVQREQRERIRAQMRGAAPSGGTQ
jgi:hypothetical protein